MTEALASLSIKLTASEKQRFCETAQAIGLTPSDAIRAFVHKFCECGGMPFELSREPKINFDNPNLIRVRIENGTAIVPASWRDEDDGE